MNLKYAKQLIREKRVKKISEKVYEVGEYTITFPVKKGRVLATCSCLNHSLYCNSNSMCQHLLAVILYEGLQNIYLGIDKLIDDYKRVNNLKMKIDTDMIIYDLESLRKMK
jgi:hypothetical protein